MLARKRVPVKNRRRCRLLPVRVAGGVGTSWRRLPWAAAGDGGAGARRRAAGSSLSAARDEPARQVPLGIGIFGSAGEARLRPAWSSTVLPHRYLLWSVTEPRRAAGGSARGSNKACYELRKTGLCWRLTSMLVAWAGAGGQAGMVSTSHARASTVQYCDRKMVRACTARGDACAPAASTTASRRPGRPRRPASARLRQKTLSHAFAPRNPEHRGRMRPTPAEMLSPQEVAGRDGARAMAP